MFLSKINIVNTLNNGDLIFFSGKDYISRTIKVVQFCQWSHVAMVIRPQCYNYEPIILESSGKMGSVIMTPLSDRMISYRGKIGVRHLKGVEFSDDDMYQLKLAQFHFIDRQFETRKLEMLRACFKWLNNKEENLDTVFCSELVAELYQVMGLLTEEHNSNNFTPRSFARNVPLDKGLLSDMVIYK
ncbi:YiiX/YebB-like N1pC/P60 family cysteine hydrolase [Catenovulum sp. SX2]|uniref:YiiX/YebB-like N1pC/P60 family cysteine hydrolase n=1 Tax=Catenovulum sp. SX2 TaxID=3398614 RepID=UPI003F828B29